MSERDDWQPIETAPKDGEVFLAANANGVIVACCIYGDVTVTKPRWPWQRAIVETEKQYIGLAIPYGDAYGVMNLRPDFGFNPTHWRPLPKPPEASGT